jgi:hypothetical protein
VHESTLIKSITYELKTTWCAKLTVCSVEFPADSVHTMATNDSYTVEQDQVMTTQ